MENSRVREYIEQLKNELEIFDDSLYVQGAMDALNAVYRKLKERHEEDFDDKWILVEEAIPEINANVLLEREFCGLKNHRIGHFNGRAWVDVLSMKENHLNDVKRWKQLF